MRLICIAIPPWSVTAPPESPVPAPRLTSGIEKRGGQADHALNLRGVRRQDHHLGRCPADRAVALEDAEIVAIADHVPVTDDRAQLPDQRDVELRHRSILGARRFPEGRDPR